MELQGRDPKKSRNLIAVVCCFCGWIDFGVLCGFGLGLRATGTLPLPSEVRFGEICGLGIVDTCRNCGFAASHELVFLLAMFGSFLCCC